MTTVTYHHNRQPGAPTLNGQAGSGISVLDATLVTGWGLQTATINVSAGVATLTTPSPHPFLLYQIALVEGASDPLLNGRHRVTARTSNSISFAAPGVADGAASGGISVRVAPAGWVKVFSGTGRAVYRSASVGGTAMLFRVDDTGTTSMRVVGLESASDVTTGEGLFPNNVQVPGGGWWPKSTLATSAPRAWTVIADSQTVYMHVATADDLGGSGCVQGFGDLSSYAPVDAFGAFVTAPPSDISNTSAIQAAGLGYVGAQGSTVDVYMPRSVTGLPGAVRASEATESQYLSLSVSGNTTGVLSQYPAFANNGLFLSRKFLLEPAPIGYRGLYRGLYVTPQSCHASFARSDLIPGQGPLDGRVLLAVKCGGPTQVTSGGVMFFDIIGPW